MKDLSILMAVIILASCSGSKQSHNKRVYRKSKELAVYTAMANEFQDDVLILKENNYFEYYRTIWLLFTIKQVPAIGKYVRQSDTLYLNWRAEDLKSGPPYLSSLCLIDSTESQIWFLDELTEVKTTRLILRKKK